MRFKCTCGKKDCKIEIMFDEDRLIFVDKKGDECLMYLDANLICELSKKLQCILLDLNYLNKGA